ncbi:hypothetical protein OIDMADRAFT_139801 [Oidiodendron maius Zn]|uniref:Fungal lipase-type domain-containing protein n=1 Tax=Oidiodendron maius (strain Zn) TaxID=913774 RepID=A0A0C3HY82_OIDMZ|nr:hypothetical protein OIDMADRAFT_139801 [Oidiodendron maius Zn]
MLLTIISLVTLFFVIGPSSAQTAVTSTVFNSIVRYTAFSSAAYGDTCANPPSGSSVVQYFNDNPTDTQATLFRDDSAREVIIAFRGTSSPKDLDTDLDFLLVPLSATGTKCASCNVHQGFQEAYLSIASSVVSAIQSQLSSHSGYTLTVTGHSLGAGIAAIGTSSLIGQGLAVSNTYTFGEPRNGDANWATYIESQISNSNYYRVTHANDGVPQIPPTVLNYVHHGTEYWESGNSTNSASTTYNCGTDSTTCNAGQDPGEDPINGSHLTYSNTVIGSSLFIPACGAVFPS